MKIPLNYLKNTQLNNSEFLAFCQKWNKKAVLFNWAEDAFWFANIIESLMSEQRGVVFPGSEMARKYEELIARARWVGLPLLSDNEIVNLFEKSLRVILFDADYDLWEVLSAKLIALLMLEDRDALKQKIVYSLLKNQEIITSNTFQLEGKIVPATVENWMREYARFVGNGPLDKLKQAQYLVESKNFTGLNAQERTGILKLIHFYERCRLSSLTLQGLEDVIPVPPEIGEGGRSGVIREGRFEPDDPDLIADFEQQLVAVNTVLGRVKESGIRNQESGVVDRGLAAGSAVKIVEAAKQAVKTTTPSPSLDKEGKELIGSLNKEGKELVNPFNKEVIDRATTPGPSLNKEGKELMGSLDKGGEESAKPFSKEGKIEPKFLPKEDMVLIPSPMVMHESHPLRVELEELINKVLQEVTQKLQEVTRSYLTDEVLKKRFRVIVSARLRGVRDGMETRDMLLRPVKIGGMGMEKRLQEVTGGYKKLQEVTTAGGYRRLQEVGEVDAVMGIIEKAFGEFEKKWKAIEEQRVEEWKKKQHAEKEEREKQEAEKEQKDLDERYNRLTGGIPNSQFLISNKSSKPEVQIPEKLVESKIEPKVEVKIVPKVEKKIPPPPTKPITPPSPPLHKWGKEAGQKITDVRTVPRLVGHIEELSGLTLQDFKRLAPNAQEATAKILSKIEFLSKESFGQRTQALAAWRRSPLNQFYTMISEQAMLKRVPPQTLLTELSQQGKPAITVEEFYAIMELNQRLRF